MPPRINVTISLIKNLQHNFSKMRRGGRVKGCLEFFQKIILFGSGILLLSRNSSFSALFNFCSQNLTLAAKNIESFPPLSSIPSCLIDVNINIHKHRSPFSPPSLTFGLKCQGRKFEHGNAKNPKLLQKHLMMMILSLINIIK